ncbi:MAG: ABC transporter permease [Acidobacteriota bacterium]
MGFGDLLRTAGSAAASERLRSLLTVLGICIGIASVVILTSIGEGTRLYVLGEFTQFGSNLLAINPGRVKTMGIPGILGGTTHPLTLDDAEALRRLDQVQHVVPLATGTATVEAGSRSRAVNVYGVTSELPAVWKFAIRSGRFLPEEDPRHPTPVAVLGPGLKRELYGDENALSRKIRVGGRRFQVIGVMAPKGQFLGIDMDDAVYIPVGAAMRLFNLKELFEIDLVFASASSSDAIEENVRALIRERHDGADDVTLTTQTEMLEVLDDVLGVVTVAVGAIGGVSLLVGAIGILTVMWISVNERTSEIGLCRALGATTGQILALFLGEAALLALAGGLVGVGLAQGTGFLLHLVLPGLPFHTPAEFMVAAIALSTSIGLASGALPARRAARLDPVIALRDE